ncbi:MAG: hypothetical protein H0V91_10325 [Flavisolibacter sp.]|nr:hypothetical protein [Flavisolibacter sp.]
MSLQNQMNNRWPVMQPQPNPEEPDKDDEGEKEERAEVDTRMLYKNWKDIFMIPAVFIYGVL